MGSFTTYPNGFQAVYHPIKFTFTHDSSAAVETCRIYLDVLVNGSHHYYTYRVGYASKVGTIYTFNFDISQFVKQHLPPFTTQVSSAFKFGVLTFTSISNPDFLASVTVNAQPEYRNASGALVDDTADGGDDTYSDLKVLPAAYRRGDTKNLTAYTTATYHSFMTKRPSGSTFCSNTENTLTFYSDYASAVLLAVNYYNAAGTNFGDTNTTLTNCAVGINTIPIDLAGILTTYPTTTRVTVQLFYSATRISEIYTMNVEKNCCAGTTFSWLNEVGGIDHYQFCGEVETEMATNNSFGEQYDDGITTRLKGIYKTQTVASEVIQVRDLLSKADVDWIKYILASHEVYVKISGSWYNCVILDSQAITESNIKGLYEFGFTARLSDIVTNHN